MEKREKDAIHTDDFFSQRSHSSKELAKKKSKGDNPKTNANPSLLTITRQKMDGSKGVGTWLPKQRAKLMGMENPTNSSIDSRNCNKKGHTLLISTRIASDAPRKKDWEFWQEKSARDNLIQQ
ncbi:hypothetical protein GBA52_025981 [Prunus armeniaca]|nr:hypothetical protein GBA52_025981 [Prunus armeniaca]